MRIQRSFLLSTCAIRLQVNPNSGCSRRKALHKGDASTVFKNKVLSVPGSTTRRHAKICLVAKQRNGNETHRDFAPARQVRFRSPRTRRRLPSEEPIVAPPQAAMRGTYGPKSLRATYRRNESTSAFGITDLCGVQPVRRNDSSPEHQDFRIWD